MLLSRLLTSRPVPTCYRGGLSSRASSVLRQQAREGLHQAPWEQRLLTPLLAGRRLLLALSFSRPSQLPLRSRQICIFHRLERCFFRWECALGSTGKWACFTVMYELCDSGWIRPTFFFFFFLLLRHCRRGQRGQRPGSVAIYTCHS